MPDFAPEILHLHLADRAARILSFDPEAYFPEWQSAVRRSFKQLLGLMPAKVSLDVRILEETDETVPVSHHKVKFIFISEPFVQIPVTLAIPTSKSAPRPLIICQQSHEIPAYGSLGESRNDPDRKHLNLGFDFGIQALKNGYAALTFDLRAMGERADARPEAAHRGNKNGCRHAALNALLLSRTLIGQRVWDIHRAIDAVTEKFSQIDPARIATFGFSVGGAAAYYAAAFDPRIAAVIAIDAVCSYKDSLAYLDRCECNYLPNILHYFDMQDLAGLIAPRPLLLVTGEKDALNPINAVTQAFLQIQQIYRVTEAPHACRLNIHPLGHQPSPEQVWPTLNEMLHWT